MKRFSEQFKKESERIKLRAAETRDLKDRVVAYMEYHPLRADVKPASHGILAEEFVAVRFNFAAWRNAAAMCAVMVLIVVPFAAERTVPGDILYPVKVRFNEEVRSGLSFSSYERVEWETTRLERRMAEVRLLANEGKLTDDVEAAAAAAVSEHAAAAQRELTALRQSDSEGAAVAQVAFATTLEAQTDALTTTLSRSGGSSAVDVAAALSSAKENAMKEESVPAFERLVALMEKRTTEAEELLTSLRANANPVTVADIERRLADVERKRSRAIAYHETPAVPETALAAKMAPEETADETSNEMSLMMSSAPAVAEAAPSTGTDEARLLLREALQATEKLILYMSDIELSSQVTVEDLVPTVPTDEEQQDTIKRLQATLETQVKAVKARIGDREDEKVDYGLTEITEHQLIAEAALEAGEYEQSIASLKTGLALASDLLRLVENLNRPVAPVSSSTATSTLTGVATSSSSATSTEPERENEE